MFKYYSLTAVIIIGGLALIYFWVGVPQIYAEPVNLVNQANSNLNNDANNSRLELTAFYFVPKNRRYAMSPDSMRQIDDALTQLVQFHDRQAQGRLPLVYTIHPEPVIGLKNSIEYDTTDTNGGNPQGLRQVATELIERGLLPENDPDGQMPYKSVLIIYEGVGAAASENVAFLNRTFIADRLYLESYGKSFMAHEFYHSLGVEDTYHYDDNTPFSHDLMGLGRYKPLELTYLDEEVVNLLLQEYE